MKTQSDTRNQAKLQSLSSPYHLSRPLQNSESFYALLEVITDNIVDEGHYRFAEKIRNYQCSLAYLKGNIQQSTDENVLDLLLIGVLWNEYKGRWGSSSIKLKDRFLKQLYILRSKNPSIKQNIDNWRGKLGQQLLDTPTDESIEISIKNLRLLYSWLSATNEFYEEVARIRSWIQFMESIPQSEVQELLHEITWFAEWFKDEGHKKLKEFTFGVQSFLKSHVQNYRGKENYFFTGRAEVEYHLNMVGSAIMNRSLRKEFLETEDQVLLLPSCMCQSNTCQSIEIMYGKVCRNCSPDCKVSIVSQEMLEKGVHTIIVQHSSDFSQSLKRWANQKKTGVIGTACTLNLLAGGFEMKRLNIPAQCVLLDYSGCKKHWNSIGIPTDISLSRIKKLVEIKDNKAV